jgi:hypothetical protein
MPIPAHQSRASPTPSEEPHLSPAPRAAPATARALADAGARIIVHYAFGTAAPFQESVVALSRRRDTRSRRYPLIVGFERDADLAVEYP